MDNLNFCYWLQGFFELTNTETLTKEQVKIIKDHLALVFEKKTPFVKLDDSVDYTPISNTLFCNSKNPVSC